MALLSPTILLRNIPLPVTRRAALAPAGDSLVALCLVVLAGRLHRDVLGKTRACPFIASIAVRQKPVPDNQVPCLHGDRRDLIAFRQPRKVRTARAAVLGLL